MAKVDSGINRRRIAKSGIQKHAGAKAQHFSVDLSARPKRLRKNSEI
jgi:hypothetical protein